MEVQTNNNIDLEAEFEKQNILRIIRNTNLHRILTQPNSYIENPKTNAFLIANGEKAFITLETGEKILL